VFNLDEAYSLNQNLQKKEIDLFDCTLYYAFIHSCCFVKRKRSLWSN